MDSDSRHSISVHVSCHIKPPSLVPTSILSICFNLTTPSDPSHFSEVVATLASSPHPSDFSICPLCILSTHPIRLLPAARLGGEPPPQHYLPAIKTLQSIASLQPLPSVTESCQNKAYLLCGLHLCYASTVPVVESLSSALFLPSLPQLQAPLRQPLQPLLTPARF